jgi:hypothetical protein
MQVVLHGNVHRTHVICCEHKHRVVPHAGALHRSGQVPDANVEHVQRRDVVGMLLVGVSDPGRCALNISKNRRLARTAPTRVGSDARPCARLGGACASRMAWMCCGSQLPRRRPS